MTYAAGLMTFSDFKPRLPKGWRQRDLYRAAQLGLFPSPSKSNGELFWLSAEIDAALSDAWTLSEIERLRASIPGRAR